MKTEQIRYTPKSGWIKNNNIELGKRAQLVLVFGDRELLKDVKNYNYIKSIYPNADIVGCSTSGSISDVEVLHGSIVCTAVYFEKTHFKVISEDIGNMEESFQLGQKLIKQFDRKDLQHIFILSDGLNINGSELTRGLNDNDIEGITITGGLAGDEANFDETVLLHNHTGMKNKIVAIGFYGQSIKIGYGSMGGWDSFGVDRLVTKSNANILYELDGKPALSLYKKYLGDHAANLPASALLFPLSFISHNSTTPIVRTILSINEADGSMTFAGNIPEGEYVRLMKASSEKLFEGASDAAAMSVNMLKHDDPSLAILISCVGRRLVLKQRIDEEIESVKETIGNTASIAGFYSYGEICPATTIDTRCELHNQTMTVTLFKEI